MDTFENRIDVTALDESIENKSVYNNAQGSQGQVRQLLSDSSEEKDWCSIQDRLIEEAKERISEFDRSRK